MSYTQSLNIPIQESAALTEIEAALRVPLPRIAKIKWNSFGFTVEDGHVTGVGLFNKELAALPEAIGDFDKLTVLNVAYNDLGRLPRGVSRLRNLRTLSAAHNKLTHITGGLPAGAKLEHLILKFNCLTHVPAELSEMAHLRYLDVDNNNLESFTANAGGYAALEYLNLGSNRYMTLVNPYVYEESSLFLFNTRDGQTAYEMQNVLMALKFNRLARLPETVSAMANLRRLYIACNGLEEIPEWFCERPQQLEEVDFSHNQIASLPVDLLKRKCRMDLSYNCIDEVIALNVATMKLTGNPGTSLHQRAR